MVTLGWGPGAVPEVEPPPAVPFVPPALSLLDEHDATRPTASAMAAPPMVRRCHRRCVGSTGSPFPVHGGRGAVPVHTGDELTPRSRAVLRAAGARTGRPMATVAHRRSSLPIHPLATAVRAPRGRVGGERWSSSQIARPPGDTRRLFFLHDQCKGMAHSPSAGVGRWARHGPGEPLGRSRCALRGRVAGPGRTPVGRWSPGRGPVDRPSRTPGSGTGRTREHRNAGPAPAAAGTAPGGTIERVPGHAPEVPGGRPPGTSPTCAPRRGRVKHNLGRPQDSSGRPQPRAPRPQDGPARPQGGPQVPTPTRRRLSGRRGPRWWCSTTRRWSTTRSTSRRRAWAAVAGRGGHPAPTAP